MTLTYHNPIIPGYYPGPSICRAGDNFYLVNSTFAWWPGLPVWHSKDLVHWQQIGHVLENPAWDGLENLGVNRGLYAPTIRHHDGTFYVICTNVGPREDPFHHNFICTSQDPAKGWSEPIWLPDDLGRIDPDLFFDDDGKIYLTLCARRPASDGRPERGSKAIYELDADTMQPASGPIYLDYNGCLRPQRSPEGLHIIKRAGWYYLILAEGGTGWSHAVTVARSQHIFGPYEAGRFNPLLTQRHLGPAADVVGVGHADLVDDGHGHWWLVCLAHRPRQHGSYLGRETFLAPLSWQEWKGETWPIIGTPDGLLARHGEVPSLMSQPWPIPTTRDDFSQPNLDQRWISLRGPALGIELNTSNSDTDTNPASGRKLH
jgi:alpha-N-arabinofuranosidase